MRLKTAAGTIGFCTFGCAISFHAALLVFIAEPTVAAPQFIGQFSPSLMRVGPKN
jgi:hypothetical protein